MNKENEEIKGLGFLNNYLEHLEMLKKCIEKEESSFMISHDFDKKTGNSFKYVNLLYQSHHDALIEILKKETSEILSLYHHKSIFSFMVSSKNNSALLNLYLENMSNEQSKSLFFGLLSDKNKNIINNLTLNSTPEYKDKECLFFDKLNYNIKINEYFKYAKDNFKRRTNKKSDFENYTENKVRKIFENKFLSKINSDGDIKKSFIQNISLQSNGGESFSFSKLNNLIGFNYGDLYINNKNFFIDLIKDKDSEAINFIHKNVDTILKENENNIGLLKYMLSDHHVNYQDKGASLISSLFENVLNNNELDKITLIEFASIHPQTILPMISRSVSDNHFFSAINEKNKEKYKEIINEYNIESNYILSMLILGKDLNSENLNRFVNASKRSFIAINDKIDNVVINNILFNMDSIISKNNKKDIDLEERKIDNIKSGIIKRKRL